MASESGPAAVFYGRYSDGKSAAASDAELKLLPGGVEIKLAASASAMLWPYASLSAAEPLSEYAIDALLTSSEAPGASLFATEGVFARRLAGLAPHLTPKAQRWANAKPWIAATGLVITAAIAISVLNLSPSHAIATLMPDKARARLGNHAIASMTGDRRRCDDAKGLAALNTLTGKLSKASGATAKFEITVIDWGLLNAFAVPGERIITTRKLISKAESPDEVAGVLAHEMGHGIELHAETGLVRAIGLSAAVELMMGGSGGTLANLGVVLATLSYSRDAERDADTHALRILKNAGISPKGLGAFFARMKDEEPELGSKVLDAVSTHPNTAERIAKINAQVGYPAKPALSDDEWQALRGICGAAKPGMDEDGDGQDDAVEPEAPANKDPAPKKKPPPQKVDKPKKSKPGRDI